MALVTARKYGIHPGIISRAQQLSQEFDTQNNSSGSSMYCGDSSSTAAVTDSPEPKARTTARRYDLSTDIVPIMRSLAGEDSPAVHIIPADWEPPAVLEGHSCVYVLQLYNPDKVRSIVVVILCASIVTCT